MIDDRYTGGKSMKNQLDNAYKIVSIDPTSLKLIERDLIDSHFRLIIRICDKRYDVLEGYKSDLLWAFDQVKSIVNKRQQMWLSELEN
jgi:hypothetical protein